MKFEILRHPCLWLAGFILWLAYLFSLSSNPESVTQGVPQFPHVDKILHFGYFLGGAGLLTTSLLLWKSPAAPATIRLVLPIALLLIIAALDEFQQSLSPGRSGNDPFDWLADAIGAITGVAIANRFHALFVKLTSGSPEKSHN